MSTEKWNSIQKQIKQKNIGVVEDELKKLFSELANGSGDVDLQSHWIFESFGKLDGNTTEDEAPTELKNYHEVMMSSGSWILQMTYCFSEAYVSSNQCFMLNFLRMVSKDLGMPMPYDGSIADINCVKYNEGDDKFEVIGIDEILAREHVRVAMSEEEDTFLKDLIIVSYGNRMTVSISYLLDGYRFVSDAPIDMLALEDKLVKAVEEAARETDLLQMGGQYIYRVKSGITRKENDFVDEDKTNPYVAAYCQFVSTISSLFEEREARSERINGLLDIISSEHFVSMRTESTKNMLLSNGTCDDPMSALDLAIKISKTLLRNGHAETLNLYNGIQAQVDDTLAKIKDEYGVTIKGDLRGRVYEKVGKYDFDYLLGGNEEDVTWDTDEMFGQIPSSSKKDELIEAIITVLVKVHAYDFAIFAHHSEPARAEALYKKLLSEREPTTPKEPAMTEDVWHDEISGEEEILAAFHMTPKNDKTPAPTQCQSPKKLDTQNSVTNTSTVFKKKEEKAEFNIPIFIWSIVNLIFGGTFGRLLGIAGVVLSVISWKKPTQKNKLITINKIVNIVGSIFALRVLINWIIILVQI